MELKEMPIGKLVPADWNPRVKLKPTDAMYRSLKKSIETYGMVDPLVWNKKTGRLVGGHQRLQVLRDMGFKSVMVSIVNLPDEDEKLLNLALNRIHGEFDFPALQELVTSIADKTKAASVTGFTGNELDSLLAMARNTHHADFLDQAVRDVIPIPRPADTSERAYQEKLARADAEEKFVTLQFVMTEEQREEIMAAARKAQLASNFQTAGEGLLLICRKYMEV